MRHGRVGAAPTGRSDAERHLLDEGRQELVAAVAGLRALGVALDRLFTSPLLRARETAALVHDGLPAPEPEVLPALGLDCAPEPLLREIADEGERIAVVGHMPSLADLIGVAASGVGSTPLHPGAVALLEFAGRPRPGGAVLRWLMTPAQLAGIRGAPES